MRYVWKASGMKQLSGTKEVMRSIVWILSPKGMKRRNAAPKKAKAEIIKANKEAKEVGNDTSKANKS